MLFIPLQTFLLSTIRTAWLFLPFVTSPVFDQWPISTSIQFFPGRTQAFLHDGIASCTMCLGNLCSCAIHRHEIIIGIKL